VLATQPLFLLQTPLRPRGKVLNGNASGEDASVSGGPNPTTFPHAPLDLEASKGFGKGCLLFVSPSGGHFADLNPLQYTEFTAYAALLAGGHPPIIQKSLVVRHRQTWKLREHHLLAPDTSLPGSGINSESDIEPLSGGDPLRSYFPSGVQMRETKDGVEVQEPNSKDVIRYHRTSCLPGSDKSRSPFVRDIIVTGEGHSAWGQFSLLGRVRPCDGFVSLCKEYVDGDRGKWLYRGYLVGNVNSNLAGRWRDTLTPTDIQGYEGCFAMSRRR